MGVILGADPDVADPVPLKVVLEVLLDAPGLELGTVSAACTGAASVTAEGLARGIGRRMSAVADWLRGEVGAVVAVVGSSGTFVVVVLAVVVVSVPAVLAVVVVVAAICGCCCCCCCVVYVTVVSTQLLPLCPSPTTHSLVSRLVLPSPPLLDPGACARALESPACSMGEQCCEDGGLEACGWSPTTY